MTANIPAPDEWDEVTLIGIIPEGGSEIAFAGLTEDITGVNLGKKGIEAIPTMSGGRIVKRIPQELGVITMKVVPITAGVGDETTATGVMQLFNPKNDGASIADRDSTEPILVDNTRNRKKFGIIFLQSALLPSTAGTRPALTYPAKRLQIVNAYMTSAPEDYGDKRLTSEIEFSFAPFQKNGSANWRMESTSGSAQLPAAITTATTL